MFVCRQDDEKSGLGHTVLLDRHVLDTYKILRLHRRLEISIGLRQKASFNPNEKMRGFFGIAKLF